ncbi:hypothetical protein GCM10009539_71290 [Cryptosporangium japonicum]|uniref:Uncharacterized protein n=2 Tax=Cryptosporangium japonicum TaxID=80872 RepID=A0ABP3ERG5_9ACTN
MASTPAEAADKLMSAIESEDKNAAESSICDGSSMNYEDAKNQVLGAAEASGGTITDVRWTVSESSKEEDSARISISLEVVAEVNDARQVDRRVLTADLRKGREWKVCSLHP